MVGRASALALVVSATAIAFTSACRRESSGDAPAPTPSPPALRAAGPGADTGVAPEARASASARPVDIDVAQLPEVPIRAGATTTVRVDWSLPAGTGVNEEAPFRVRWDRSEGLAEAPPDVKSTGGTVKEGLRVSVMPAAGVDHATLAGKIDLVVCDVATHSVCVPVRRAVEINFVVDKKAPPETRVSLPLPAAKS